MTRGRPRAFDKTQALDTALRLFWRYGYEGTSIAAPAEQIGITMPSLYLAFGNKESLFMQAVEHYERYSGALYTDVLASPSAREVALGILQGEVELVAGGETPEGCLMVQGALATSPGAEKVRACLAEQRRKAQSLVAERFERARLEGDLPEGWEPQALASYIMTVASGMAVQAKSGASRQELLDVVETAMLIWPPQVGESRSGRRVRA
jgi:AcrR family transcriptional regulator